MLLILTGLVRGPLAINHVVVGLVDTQPGAHEPRQASFYVHGGALCCTQNRCAKSVLRARFLRNFEWSHGATSTRGCALVQMEV